MAPDLLYFLHLFAAGVLTGNELGTWAVVHPAIQRLPFAEEVHAEQEVTRRYGRFMPALMLITIVSGFVLAEGVDGTPGSLALAGSICFAAMLALTLVGNVPLNVRTLRFTETDPPEQWRAARPRWDRLHATRIALDVAGFTCALFSLILR